MDKLNYIKALTTENDEKVGVATYDNHSDMYIILVDDEQECSVVNLNLREAQQLKSYLEDAITTNIMNWEEE